MPEVPAFHKNVHGAAGSVTSVDVPAMGVGKRKRPPAPPGASTSGTLVANAWNTLPISATLQPNTAYWLVYNTNGRSNGVNDLQFDTGAANVGVRSGNAKFGTWPTTFGTSTLSSASHSMYISGR